MSKGTPSACHVGVHVVHLMYVFYYFCFSGMVSECLGSRELRTSVATCGRRTAFLQRGM